MRTIITEEGVLGLYQGLFPAALGSALSWGLYMVLYVSIYITRVRTKKLAHIKPSVSYNKAKDLWKRQQEEGKNLHAAHHLVCATVAGVMTSACTNPIWVIKTRMQLQTYGAQGNYKGFAGENASLLLQVWPNFRDWY